MEHKEFEKLSLFDTFKQQGKVISQNDRYIEYELKYDDAVYTVYQSVKTANKRTQVHCLDCGDIVLEQFYLSGGITAVISEKSVLLRAQYDKNRVTVVVISGKPGVICGLDEGMFISARYKGNKKGIYVMSEAAFKCFVP